VAAGGAVRWADDRVVAIPQENGTTVVNFEREESTVVQELRVGAALREIMTQHKNSWKGHGHGRH
jgi:hypothetical protein